MKEKLDWCVGMCRLNVWYDGCVAKCSLSWKWIRAHGASYKSVVLPSWERPLRTPKIISAALSSYFSEYGVIKSARNDGQYCEIKSRVVRNRSPLLRSSSFCVIEGRVWLIQGFKPAAFLSDPSSLVQRRASFVSSFLWFPSAESVCSRSLTHSMPFLHTPRLTNNICCLSGKRG